MNKRELDVKVIYARWLVFFLLMLLIILGFYIFAKTQGVPSNEPFFEYLLNFCKKALDPRKIFSFFY